jgi:hypothetical protein
MEQIIGVEFITTRNASRIDSDRSRQSIDPGSVSICDGFGCNRKATIEVMVKAGKLGIINLNLCENCKPRFKQSVVKENTTK